MESRAPVRATCAKPDCPSSEHITVECQWCQLVRYCSDDCWEQDQARHRSLCEAHQNRKGNSYRVGQDTRKLVVEDDVELPYPHLKPGTLYEGPKHGQEPRLFSSHKVKSLVIPDVTKAGDEIKGGDEINISIDGFGDLGMLIESFLSIPRDTSNAYTFHMEEADEEAVARLFVLLTIAANGRNYLQTAEAMLHYWYSAFLPFWAVQLLENHPQNAALDVQSKCGNTDEAQVQAKFTHGNKSPTNLYMIWFSNKFARESLVSFTQASHLPKGRALLQRAHNISRRRRDIAVELKQKAHPEWRSSQMEYLKTGVLGPITASKEGFRHPNPAFFRDWERCRDYGFDPMEAWGDIYEHVSTSNLPEDDGHGNFFYYMRHKLVRFLHALDNTKNYKIIVTPQSFPAPKFDWTTKWPAALKMTLVTIEDLKNFILNNQERKDDSPQDARVEQVTDTHPEKIDEVIDDQKDNYQKPQSGKQSHRKRLTKSERRKAALTKKRKLAASKSTKKGRGNLMPREEPTVHNPDPESDTTSGSYRVVFTPSISSGSSEPVAREHLHQQLPVTSPEDDGEDEQEQHGQETDQEGMVSSLPTAVHEEPASSPTNILQKQPAALSTEETEDQSVMAAKQTKPKKAAKKIQFGSLPVFTPTTDSRNITPCLSSFGSLPSEATASLTPSIATSHIPDQQPETTKRRVREVRDAHSKPLPRAGENLWNVYIGDVVSTSEERGLEHTGAEANVEADSQPLMQVPRLPAPVQLSGPEIGLWSEAPEQEAPEEAIHEAPKKPIHEAPEEPIHEAADNEEGTSAELPSFSQVVATTQVPLASQGRDPAADLRLAPMVNRHRAVPDVVARPGEHIVHQEILIRHGRRVGILTATAAGSPEPVDPVEPQMSYNQAAPHPSAYQALQYPDEIEPTTYHPEPVSQPDEQTGDNQPVPQTGDDVPDSATQISDDINPVVADSHTENHAVTGGSDDVEVQDAAGEDETGNDAVLAGQAQDMDVAKDVDNGGDAIVDEIAGAEAQGDKPKPLTKTQKKRKKRQAKNKSENDTAAAEAQVLAEARKANVPAHEAQAMESFLENSGYTAEQLSSRELDAGGAFSPLNILAAAAVAKAEEKTGHSKAEQTRAFLKKLESARPATQTTSDDSAANPPGPASLELLVPSEPDTNTDAQTYDTPSNTPETVLSDDSPVNAPVSSSFEDLDQSESEYEDQTHENSVNKPAIVTNTFPWPRPCPGPALRPEHSRERYPDPQRLHSRQPHGAREGYLAYLGGSERPYEAATGPLDQRRRGHR
ncbi:hypothetical protein PG993_007234 [Apiospora rasikravindrae]|uniref:MYND-type domain-containing protein n=1 Tax=Apiospora rasikravindrae TaxID=990691 RepID=A0ABR1SZ55_9PEZI